MIDKLEVLVPEGVPRREEVWRENREHFANLGSIFGRTLDADFSLALRVHRDFRVPIAKEKRHFKVDFTDTRLMSADDILWRLMWLFEVDQEQALSFRIGRIDFAADVYGVSVEWFKLNSRVKRKRTTLSYEGCKEETSKGNITSVAFGKRPDMYRIYDRVAEKRHRGAETLYDGMSLGAPVPIVTRVERQCSGRAVPKDVATVGALLEHASTVDPFPALWCREKNDGSPSTEGWPPQKWLMNEGLAAVVQRYGEATVRARLNRGRNAMRIFSRYSELLSENSTGVTADRIHEIYRFGTVKQLNIPVRGPDRELQYPADGVVLTL